jgi:APA family basic amino acid/polyamine antiporter
MVMIMGQSRIFLGMSKDGLIPKTFSKVNPRQVPSKNLIILGGVISVVASFTPINDLAYDQFWNLVRVHNGMCSSLGIES